MARGRKPIPDAVKAAKGNPGKRKLMLEQPGALAVEEAAAGLGQPGFLTTADERAIFKRLSELLTPRRFVRESDAYGLARYASYLAQWARAKKQLGVKPISYETKSKHGGMLRTHPLFEGMMKLERIMIPLEDRLGLNPVARQMIVKGLMQPAPPPTDLFERPATPAAEGADAAQATGALGFLASSSDAKH